MDTGGCPSRPFLGRLREAPLPEAPLPYSMTTAVPLALTISMLPPLPIVS